MEEHLPSTKKPRDEARLSLCSAGSEQAVVPLDDLGFLDIEREFVTLWHAEEGSLELLSVDGDESDGRWAGIHGFLDALEWGLFFEGDHIVDFAEVGRDINLLAVDKDVAVVDELTGSCASAGESDAIDEVVQAGFKDAEEGKSGDGRLFLCDEEEAAELTLVQTIVVAEFLLLSKLSGVLGWFSLAVLSVLTRTKWSLLEFVSSFEDGET